MDKRPFTVRLQFLRSTISYHWGSRLLARRQETTRRKETAIQSVIQTSSSSTPSLQHYLLTFVDDGQHVIVPEVKIREFVDDHAVVLIGRKHRMGKIEAQGI